VYTTLHEIFIARDIMREIMSQWSVYRVSLSNPSFDILLEATRKVAERIGGEVAFNYEVRGFGGRREVCPIAIKLPGKYGNGVGIRVVDEDSSSKIEVVGDTWGMPVTVEEVGAMIVEKYVSIVMIKSLEAMGFHILDVKEDPDGVEVEAAK